MPKMISFQMLKVVMGLLVGVLAFAILHQLVLLLIAFLAPGYWPKDNVLTTALPGFVLPTIYLPYRLIFIGREIAKIGLAALFVLPISGIVRSLNKDAAFTSGNIVRIRLVALACGIYGLGPSLIPLLPIDVRIPLGLLDGFVSLPVVAMALVALALAEIFKEGRALLEDVQATI